tara:strand:+ start:1967 stop:2242 length:276 start_codon:yes stop_codon:yes gene_type:complete
MKYYVTKIELQLADSKLISTETILTKPSDKAAAVEGKRRYSALGIDNLCVVKYKKKHYNKVLRAQNKRRKEKALTVADIAKMTEEAREEGI